MPLITTIAEFKQYIAIDANMKMATLLPYVKEAEQMFMVDLLGQAFYEELVESYTASKAETPVALSEDIANLLPYVQRCLAYYTQLLSIPHLAVTFGDMGIRQHRSEDSDAAPQKLQDKLQFNALRNGDIHADKLLEFLEANATADNDYEPWFSSTANTKNSGFIIYSTAIASRHIDINSSRRVFLKLRSKMREIETRIIPKLIGIDQYEELVVQLRAGTVTEANQELIDKIEPVICKRALFLQLPFMRVQINENGIFLYSGTDDILRGNVASESDIKQLRCQLMDEPLGYLSDEQELRQFILDNIDDYPLIKASTVYTVQPDPGPTWRTPDPGPNDKWFSV